VIRSFFFGLGVFLGFVAPQVAPELAVRIYRVGNEVFLNAEVFGAFPAGSLELAEEGTTVAFEIEARVQGSDATAVAERSLRFDLASGTWIVGFDGSSAPKSVPDREAALELSDKVWGLRIGSLTAFSGGGSILVHAKSGIVDESGKWHDAGILWGYAEPQRRFSFESSVEIPR